MANDLKVVVLIYSGRPDPQWQLTKSEAEHFLALFNNSINSETEATIPSILGYKGMRLMSAQKQFLLHNGLITCFEQGHRSSKRDAEKNIEKYLLSTAPEKTLKVLKQLNIL